MKSDGKHGAAAFLASEVDYGEPAWLDSYSMAISRSNPVLAPEEDVALARAAYLTQGHTNPKVSAGLDAMLGQYVPSW